MAPGRTYRMSFAFSGIPINPDGRPSLTAPIAVRLRDRPAPGDERRARAAGVSRCRARHFACLTGRDRSASGRRRPSRSLQSHGDAWPDFGSRGRDRPDSRPGDDEKAVQQVGCTNRNRTGHWPCCSVADNASRQRTVTRMRDRHPPFMIQRAASHAFGNTALSAIGLSVAKHAVGHPGLTGVALVEDGIDAFAIRSRLIAAAERSIDLQYYIWRDDLTGNLLLEDLRRAAARCGSVCWLTITAFPASTANCAGGQRPFRNPHFQSVSKPTLQAARFPAGFPPRQSQDAFEKLYSRQSDNLCRRA